MPRPVLPLLLAAGLALAGCILPEDEGRAPLLDQIREAHAYLATPEAAEAAGYVRVTGYVPQMGYHYMHPEYVQQPFDALRPPLLTYVYEASGALRLGAVEYSVPRESDYPPAGLPGSDDVWGIHEAACHYGDMSEIAHAAAELCPAAHPATGAAYELWHPDLWTLHVWLYEENPDGVFAAFNPAAGAPPSSERDA